MRVNGEIEFEEALDLCLRAGNLMLKHGAETSRCEETIMRFGRAMGADVVHSFVIPTGIFISLYKDGREKTGMIRTSAAQSINLQKVHQVNDISRKFERGQLSAHEVSGLLKDIEKSPYYYRLRYQHLASAVSSGAFTFLFGGHLPEFFIGAICGWVTNSVAESFAELIPRFLRVFFAALVGVTLAVLGVTFHIGTEMDAAIIGAVIPLVPGVSLTNSVRDLMAGELLAGVARASDAALTAFAIAAAVAFVLVLRVHLTGVMVR